MLELPTNFGNAHHKQTLMVRLNGPLAASGRACGERQSHRHFRTKDRGLYLAQA